MRSNNEKLSALRIVDVARWRAEIIAAFKLKKGNIEATAERLNIHRATLHRWLAEDSQLRAAKRQTLKEGEVT